MEEHTQAKQEASESRQITVVVPLTDEMDDRILWIADFARNRLGREWSRADILFKSCKLRVAEAAAVRALSISMNGGEDKVLDELNRIMKDKLSLVNRRSEKGEGVPSLVFKGYYAELLDWTLECHGCDSPSVLILEGLSRLEALCRKYQKNPRGFGVEVCGRFNFSDAGVKCMGDTGELRFQYTWTTVFDVWLG